MAVYTSATPGAAICYTTDGSEPSEASTPYTGPVSLSASATVKAKAFRAGWTSSDTASATYTLQVANVTLSPGPGTYATPQAVTLSCSTPGATIHYTTTGADPTEADPAVVPGGTIVVDRVLTLKAKAWKPAWTPSGVTSAMYTLKVGTPVLSPVQGGYSSAQTVSLTAVTPDAAIHYTTNGVEPTEVDASVSSGGTLIVDRTTTVKAKAFRPHWVASDTARGSYVLGLGTVAAPTLTPAGGVYATPQTVRLKTSTPGAVIRYTLDGSEPAPGSRLYTASFVVERTLTLQAKAFRADMTPSAATVGTYTIDTGAVAAPSFSPGAGIYTTRKTVTVTCATPEATIHYTTSGADPTEADSVVSAGGAVTVDGSRILKARAFKSGLPSSLVTRADYVVTGQVAAGGYHSLALKWDGTLLAWGANGRGQVGDGTSGNIRTTPVPVIDPADPAGVLTDVVASAAGEDHSLALKSDGTVVAWGWNLFGQVGNGTCGTNCKTPVPVNGLSGVVAIAAGGNHSLALKSDGTVMAWGKNAHGQVGDGTSNNNRTSPVAVSNLTGVVTITAGGDHSLALKADGTVVAWGYNTFGQLGDGTQVSRSTPVPVAGLTGVTAIDAGAIHSTALKTDGLVSGRVWAWGSNQSSELGDGTTAMRTTPASGLSDAVALTAGAYHGTALTSTGSVWAWGTGDGTNVPRSSPGRLLGLGDLLSIDGGGGCCSCCGGHTLAVTLEGRVVGWGFNPFEQAGGATGLTLVDNAFLTQDTDGDGVTNGVEYRLGTDPLSWDTNGDGLSDGAAFGLGRNATSADVDADGLGNDEEISLGTDPFRADTDGDGVLDGADGFPLDPTRSALPPPNPADTTPPVITLLQPTNATPVP